MKTILILLLTASPLIAAPYDVPNKDEEWENVDGILISLRVGTALYHWEIVEKHEDIDWGDLFRPVSGTIRVLWRKVYYEVEWIGFIVIAEKGIEKNGEKFINIYPEERYEEIGLRKDGMVVWREIPESKTQIEGAK